jgi:hypothetical protein
MVGLYNQAAREVSKESKMMDENLVQRSIAIG